MTTTTRSGKYQWLWLPPKALKVASSCMSNRVVRGLGCCLSHHPWAWQADYEETLTTILKRFMRQMGHVCTHTIVHAILPTLPSKPLNLIHVIHALDAINNLLSMSKISYDNNVYWSFILMLFLERTRTQENPLLIRGRCDRNPYGIKYHVINQALSSFKVSHDMLHNLSYSLICKWFNMFLCSHDLPSIIESNKK
jgi:hypothetical protein